MIIEKFQKMTTITIEIEDSETDFLKKVLERMNVKILEETDKIPNQLTQKTISDAKKRKGLSASFTDVNEFMSSI